MKLADRTRPLSLSPQWLAAALLALLFISIPVHALEPLDGPALRASLDALIDGHATARRTTVTLKVVDAQTGETLYDRGGDRLLTPASNLKIYTSAAALDLLGPEFQWRTPVRTEFDTHRVTVTIEGAGDPMLDTPWLWRVAADVVAAVEERRLPDAFVEVVIREPWAWVGLPDKGPGWMWDDEPDYYNMTITPLMIDFNTLKVRVSAPDAAALRPRVAFEPASSYPPLENRATVAQPPESVGAALAGEGAALRAITIDREPFTDAVIVAGSISPGAEPVEDRITMHRPSRWIASALATKIADEGLAVAGYGVERGEEGERPTPRETKTRHHLGQPLSAIVRHFNKVSENAIGEMLLLNLGQRFGDTEQYGAGASWPKGAAVIGDWLVHTAGLEEGSFRLVDGSGLSRYNLISADSSTRLLRFMHKHEHADVFVASLPIYAVVLPSGERWNGEPIEGFDADRVFAKPGGMSGVNTISGYLDTLDGRRLAFSLLTNGYIGSSALSRDLRGKVWSLLARYRPE